MSVSPRPIDKDNKTTKRVHQPLIHCLTKQRHPQLSICFGAVH